MAGDRLVDALVVQGGLDRIGEGGANSIGLYAAGLAIALGSVHVVYADQSANRLAIAASLGAEAVDGPWPRKLGSNRHGPALVHRRGRVQCQSKTSGSAHT
jgi:alcohol dehydrogenase